jgi:hypothetical protein
MTITPTPKRQFGDLRVLAFPILRSALSPTIRIIGSARTKKWIVIAMALMIVRKVPGRALESERALVAQPVCWLA